MCCNTTGPLAFKDESFCVFPTIHWIVDTIHIVVHILICGQIIFWIHFVNFWTDLKLNFKSTTSVPKVAKKVQFVKMVQNFRIGQNNQIDQNIQNSQNNQIDQNIQNSQNNKNSQNTQISPNNQNSPSNQIVKIAKLVLRIKITKIAKTSKWPKYSKILKIAKVIKIAKIGSQSS